VTQQPNGILDDGGGYDGDDDDKEGCDVIALRRCSHHEKHGTLLLNS
jgi:hypothetical protein